MTHATRSRDRIRAVLGKELRELRKNKMVLLPMAILPTLFVVMMIVINVAIGQSPSAPAHKVQGFAAPAELAALGMNLAMQVLVNDHFMFMQLLMPVILPTVIAAHSVIGEKQARTLEPLLATPVRTWELLAAKIVAAAVPATLISWLAYVVALGGVHAASGSVVAGYLARPLWSVGVLVGAPLLGIFSSAGTVLISSRVNDVRTAQAMAGIGVVPLVAVGMSVLIGQRFLDLGFLLASIAVLVPLDLGLLWLAVRLFRRETILTRWK